MFLRWTPFLAVTVSPVGAEGTEVCRWHGHHGCQAPCHRPLMHLRQRPRQERADWAEGTEFSSQLVFSVLGQTETGPFPELIDDLIKAVKIYLCIKRVHPGSGQRAQSALSRLREILPTDITSVLLLNSLVKVIKMFRDKRKICNYNHRAASSHIQGRTAPLPPWPCTTPRYPEERESWEGLVLPRGVVVACYMYFTKASFFFLYKFIFGPSEFYVKAVLLHRIEWF